MNRIEIVPTVYTDYDPTMTQVIGETAGFRIFDDYDHEYNNLFDSRKRLVDELQKTPGSNMGAKWLRLVMANSNSDALGSLLGEIEEAKEIFIGDVRYDWEAIKEVFEDEND